MAYMDHQQSFGLTPAALRRKPAALRAHPAAFTPAVASPAALSPIEWLVVAIAEHDGVASLHTPSRLSRTLGALFGSWRAPGLANPRLETLRRIAVLLWRKGEDVAQPEIMAFRAEGYTQAHYELVAASIAAARAGRQR